MVKVLQERERVYLGKARDDPRHDGISAKGPRKREQELKVSQCEKNQGIILKFSRCFIKDLKSKL